MSASKWAYSPEKCDGKPCPGDCDECTHSGYKSVQFRKFTWEQASIKAFGQNVTMDGEYALDEAKKLLALDIANVLINSGMLKVAYRFDPYHDKHSFSWACKMAEPIHINVVGEGMEELHGL